MYNMKKLLVLVGVTAALQCFAARNVGRGFGAPTIVIPGTQVARQWWDAGRVARGRYFHKCWPPMAREGVENVNAFVLGYDIEGFAKKGDVLWEARIVEARLGLRAIAWVNPCSKNVYFLLTREKKDTFVAVVNDVDALREHIDENEAVRIAVKEYSGQMSGNLAGERVDQPESVKLGINVKDFAKNGDKVWELCVVSSAEGEERLRAMIWVHSLTGKVRVLAAPWISKADADSLVQGNVTEPDAPWFSTKRSESVEDCLARRKYDRCPEMLSLDFPGEMRPTSRVLKRGWSSVQVADAADTNLTVNVDVFIGDSVAGAQTAMDEWFARRPAPPRPFLLANKETCKVGDLCCFDMKGAWSSAIFVRNNVFAVVKPGTANESQIRKVAEILDDLIVRQSSNESAEK